MSKKFLSPIKLAQGASLPATGSAGELFFNTTDLKVYSHDGTTWNSVGGGAIPSDTAPSNPTAGMLWWKTNEGTLWTYYYDGDSYQWVEATNVIANVEPNPIPAGAIMAWTSDLIPSNWLLCDGSAVSRTTYTSLFAAIGTTYGVGDGSTTFNLPNLKGKTVVGKDSSQTEFDTLGETGGAKTHTLTTAEMPSHTHTQDAHSHTYSGTTSTAGNHNHAIYVDSTQLRYINTSASQSSGMGGLAGIAGGADNLRTGTNGDHTHTYSGTTSSVAATNQSTGGGGAHNNLQPYIVLNYIIKFSAGETPGDSQLAVRVGTLETQNNATPISQNYLINGAYDFWQRGTSFSTSAAYTADRWVAVAASGQTLSVSQQTFTPGAAPVAGYEGTYYTRIAWSGTPSGYFWYNQKVEDVRTLAGQTATLSFWAKASTATSALNSTIELNMGSGGAGGVTLNGSALSLTTSWARYSTTFTLPSLSGKTIGTSSYLDVRLLQGSSSVSGINIDIWGAQLEAGAYTTPFRRNAPSIQAELAACQRYYETGDSRLLGLGVDTGAAYYQIYARQPFNVNKRAAPTITSQVTTGATFGFDASKQALGVYGYNNGSSSVNFAATWQASAEL